MRNAALPYTGRVTERPLDALSERIDEYAALPHRRQHGARRSCGGRLLGDQTESTFLRVPARRKRFIRKDDTSNMKTIGLVSLGCSKNRVDSEVMLGMLSQAGYAIVADPRKAEIIIVNTCGFILSAKEESIDTILEMAEYKKSGQRVLTTPPYSAYVKLSDGCSNRCTYCAIPLIRGPYHSRPFDDIVNECRTLTENGVTELTLIAQDTSRYGNDFPEGKLLLPQLLHTEDRVLRSMNRRGSQALIRKLIRRCRERDILIRTTLMVGFPGETDAEYEAMLDFMREARFDRLGAFAYSPEEGTVAAEMPDQIDEEIKQERLDRLMLLQQEISAESCAKRVGETAEVLVEGFRRGKYYGRSRLEAPEIDGKVLFTSQKKLRPGEYVNVHITSSSEYDLTGEAVKRDD